VKGRALKQRKKQGRTGLAERHSTNKRFCGGGENSLQGEREKKGLASGREGHGRTVCRITEEIGMSDVGKGEGDNKELKGCWLYLKLRGRGHRDLVDARRGLGLIKARHST